MVAAKIERRLAGSMEGKHGKTVALGGFVFRPPSCKRRWSNPGPEGGESRHGPGDRGFAIS
jgi:hypothetical protein